MTPLDQGQALCPPIHDTRHQRKERGWDSDEHDNQNRGGSNSMRTAAGLCRRPFYQPPGSAAGNFNTTVQMITPQKTPPQAWSTAVEVLVPAALILTAMLAFLLGEIR